MKEGWEIKTIDKVSEVYNGNSINAEYKRKHFCGLNEGYPFIATKDVAINGIVDYDNGVKIPYDTKYKIAEPNSVFICAEGGSAGRKVAYIDRKVCFGNKLFCIKPNSEKLLGKYVYYYTNSDGFQNQFKTLLAGLIGGVSISKFKSISIPLPPLSEQRKIVEFLDTQFRNIDALKNNAEQQLQAAKDLFQSALASLLTPKNEWETKTLKEIGKTQTGCTPPMSHKEYYNEDYMPFVKPSEINYDGLGNINYATQMLSKKGAAAGRVFEPYSIFMVCIGASIGKLGISDREISCNQQINILTPTDKYISKFIYYAMRNPKFTNTVIKEGLSATATLPIINKSKWENLSISIPPLPEQQEIADKLDTLSRKLQSLQDNYTQTLTLCNDLKQALLKQIFE